jgi:hypothetical protein
MRRPFVRSLLVCAALAGCGPAAPLDAGSVDAPEPLDAALDASVDAPRDASGADARPVDAPGSDAPRFDAGRDASGGGLDAGPEVAAAVEQALDLLCGVPARASCTAPWLCGCEVSSPPPLDVSACEIRERFECDTRLRDTLAGFFARGGVTVDAAALAACTALAEQSYDQCLPRPVSDSDQPGSCWDAFVLGTAVGSPCDVSGVRCGGGAGVCAGRVCTAAGDAVGARCFGTCTAGLVCLDGACADPVAASGAGTDHEDCAASELCVGGRCQAPSAVGASCEGPDRCVAGAACEAGTCRSASPRCVAGGAEGCGSGADCRAGSTTTCQPRRSAGEACFGDNECAPELLCDTETRFPGECETPPLAGQPCASRCAPGLVCVTTDFVSGRCEPTRRLGESCSGVFARQGSLCEDGLGCVGGFCGPLPRLDEPCAEDNRCEAGLVCLIDRVTFLSRCRPPLPEGADCSSSVDGCADGLYCDFSSFFSSVCRAVPSEGQECTGTCGSGLDCRFFPTLSRSICVPPPGLGEDCTGACTVGAFCTTDLSAGRCVQRICDIVSPGGGPFPPPVPF